MSSKPLNLLLNGLGEHRTIGRDADIDGRGHSWSPFGGALWGGKGACRRAVSVGSIAGAMDTLLGKLLYF
jgi:hypothetical protein